MNPSTLDGQASNQGIAFIGDTLAPLFLFDPLSGRLDDELSYLATAELTGLAASWPFVASEDAAAAFSDMQAGLAAGAADRALHDEYKRLFIGPDAKPAPPWGSVYTDVDSVVFGEGTLALRAWMQAHGVRFHPSENEPEDHIGYMLAQMSWLARNRADLLADFLRLHLLTWSDHFLSAFIAATTHPFYAGLGALTRASLTGIQDALGLEVVYPHYYR
jgi:TorA maturation chaperone TorD